jgi:antirestriction protein ArdC
MAKTKTEMLEDYKLKVNDHLLSVAQKVIDALEKEMKTKKIEPWETSVVSTMYHNPESLTEYNFENSALLYLSSSLGDYKDKRFVTAKQAFDNGMSMERGTTGHKIVQRFAMPISPVFKRDSSGQTLKDLSGKAIPDRDDKGKVKYFYKRAEKLATVFNLEQLSGDIPERWNKKIIQKTELTNESQLRDFIKLLEDHSPAKIQRHNRAENYYVPSQDVIFVSQSDMFRNSMREANTMLHEMSHATGHESRLNRESLKNYSTLRGYEELVANFSARSLGMKYNISSESQTEEFHRNHDAYDASWSKDALNKNPMAIFEAMAEAQRAFNLNVKIIDVNLKNYPELKNLSDKNKEINEQKEAKNKDYEEKIKAKPKRRTVRPK